MIQEPDNDTELLTVTENDFEEALNDTITETDGFVAPNYDYATTLNAPMKTVEEMDGDNFINARIRPFHDTNQVRKNIGDPSTARIWFNGMENPVGPGRYNITALLEAHFHKLTMRMKTTFTK